VHCPSCGSDNPERAKFCIDCGTSLKNLCPSCESDNLARAKFCAECGTPLTGQTPTPTQTDRELDKQEGQAEHRAPEGERRQLTVMFCDLVGSTSLSEQLDPEELREVVRAYQERCGQVIDRFEGHIAQYLGDGLLVYFGYPAAHEDDAARAVRAGLGIVEELHDLNTRLPQPIQVRIGIHTGQVVVGEMGGGRRHEQLALGETPNIAARMQGIAQPDTVVISSATCRLVEGLFECQDLGPQDLKGITTPMSLYRVLSESTAQSRFEVAVRTGLTPLVGREEEVNLLRKRWQQAKGGQGQAVTLSGEPGIGKSRLVQELREQVLKEGGIRIEYRCSPYHQNSALYPVIEHLEKVLEFESDDTPAAKLEKLQSTLSAYRFPQTDTVPLLAALLSLPHPEGYSPITVSAQKQKEKTQAVLVAWLFEESEKAPVCCTWEDLHWADPSTLEFSSLCLDQIPTACMLTLLTFRPEFTSPWGTHSYLSQITLNRLGRTQVEAMVEKVTGGKMLPVEVVEQIVSKTDGVPLFVEELTKTVVESGLVKEEDGHYELRGPLPPLAIPSTLQDSLMARLDRLARVKEVAQLGATIGREFSYELLQAVSPLEEVTLQRGLRQLVEAEFLYQRGLPSQARYLFKHALIQDTAYESLLRSKRREYHQQIAQVLEKRFTETVETQPELVAHHYTEAGLVEKAIPFWQRAGERAIERSAHTEAISHLTRGLELLKALPDTPERIQQELFLQTTLGPALMAIKGYGAPEVEQAYARARELCQQTRDTSQLVPVLWGSSQVYILRADVPKHRDIAERLLSLSQSQQDPVSMMAAHWVMGANLFHAGDCAASREHTGQAYTLYDPEQHRAHMELFGIDLGVFALSYMAHTLWCLGYPEQALHKSHEAVALAQKLSHPFSLTVALAYAAMLYQFRRQMHAARERAEATVALCKEQGFAYYLAWGTIVQGWVGVESGEVEDGMAKMQQGLAALRATGSGLRLPYYRALLAAAFGKMGHVAKGLRALGEAFADVQQTGERWLEAELHRLKGELLLQQSSDNQTEAEICFHQAISIAQNQQAKFWELRAATSLARLWQSQGKTTEACELLSPVYNWFTEGFDTADLKDAKALLEELG